jgi:hypothetical protein
MLQISPIIQSYNGIQMHPNVSTYIIYKFLVYNLWHKRRFIESKYTCKVYTVILIKLIEYQQTNHTCTTLM